MKNIDDFKSTIKGLTADQFFEQFPTICSQFQNELNVLTFGIIIYDETTPELRKVLRDTDYWEALDRLSGDKMVIFSLPDHVSQTVQSDSDIDTGKVGYLVPLNFRVPSQPLVKRHSYLMKRLFNNDSLLVYPSVLFFQVVGTEIYDYRLVPLQKDDIHKSYTAVRGLFECISNVLNDIAPENFGNRKEIFNLVKDHLLTRDYTLYIYKGAKHTMDLVKLFKSLFA